MNDNRPIALYNCDKKELIGLFSELIILAKYLRPTDPNKSYSNLFYSLKHNGAIKKTVFDFSVTVRYANEDQRKILGDERCVIMGDYPKVGANILEGYHSSRVELYMTGKRKGYG